MAIRRSKKAKPPVEKAKPPVEKAEKPPLFKVESVQHVHLTFPKSVYSLYGNDKVDFGKNLTPTEARLLAAALNQSADKIKEC